jgi:hypothetical protein
MTWGEIVFARGIAVFTNLLYAYFLYEGILPVYGAIPAMVATKVAVNSTNYALVGLLTRSFGSKKKFAKKVIIATTLGAIFAKPYEVFKESAVDMFL